MKKTGKSLFINRLFRGSALAVAASAMVTIGCTNGSIDSSPRETDHTDTDTEEIAYSDSESNPDTLPGEGTDGIPVNDECPDDPNKTTPGICGCGISDDDSDGDSVPNCLDICPSDPEKQDLGLCGCGIKDTDTDRDGTPDCKDICSTDPNKTEPGACGCGSPEHACASDTDTSTDTDTEAFPEDTIRPEPGHDGTITISAVGENKLTLRWEKASDNEVAQDRLTYKIVRSYQPNIDTVEGAESATVIHSWTADIDRFDAAGLSAGETYYFNVLVQDERENKAVYRMTSQTTCRYLGNLTAHFPFSGNFEDSGPHGITLTPSASSPILDLDRAGNSNRSYLFTAANGEYFLNADYPSPLGVENELTVSFWVNLTGAAADEKIISRALYNDGYSGWAIGVSSNADELILFPEIWDSKGGHYSFSTGSFTPGAWTHLAVTWKTGGRFKGYVDGILVQEIYASNSPIANVEGARFMIGARSWKFPKFFVDGNVDDIRIYDWELNATEILALKNLPAE